MKTITATTAALIAGLALGYALPRPEQQTAHTNAPAITQLALTREITARAFDVRRIIDGDTFVIMYDGEPTSVRIAGIDTPERGEPGAGEATAALRDLIAGETVTLTFIDPRRKRDNFGRLLAAVVVDGRDVGEAMAEWAE